MYIKLYIAGDVYASVEKMKCMFVYIFYRHGNGTSFLPLEMRLRAG